jgi:hypothetical protein
MQFEQYEHHGKDVWVRSDLKGKHNEYCLCSQCTNFKPGTDYNCEIAELLFRINILAKITTPVWECKEFRQR